MATCLPEGRRSTRGCKPAICYWTPTTPSDHGLWPRDDRVASTESKSPGPDSPEDSNGTTGSPFHGAGGGVEAVRAARGRHSAAAILYNQ